ncbi:RNA recognition motif, partial [Trifolium medium]|nr:RNA recognition motif [Trifolium medium]
MLEREGEEWRVKARASKEKRRGFIHNLDKVTTSFFVTNFPQDATADDLWRLFLEYGRVAEVYIPKKLDKRGRRFTFVKFKEVKEVEELSDCLRDVWIGNFKLRVNRSRFARSDAKDGKHSKAPLLEPADKKEEPKFGKSFRTALTGSRGSGSASVEVQVIKASVNEDLWKELKGSMVGKLAREKDVNRIQTTLY